MNPELGLFRDSVRRWVSGELVPQQDLWREQKRPEAEAWVRAGRMGFLLTDVPEAYGGMGGTFAHTALIVAELSRAGVNFAIFVHNSVAHYILAYATDEQQHAWLPRMASGELVGAVAFTEPGAGSDLAGISATAQRDGDHFILTGTKTFVTNGWHAGIACVAARTDPLGLGSKAVSLFIVELNGLPGYSVGQPLKKVGMHGQDTCEMFFDHVRVPAENLLGGVAGRGIPQAMEKMDYERLAIAVAAVAVSEEAVRITTDYVRSRSAFGKPLFELQNTRFKLAECSTEAMLARVFLDHCIERHIQGRLDSQAVARAKYWITESECRIVDDCVQLHGGYGYMTEFPIARMWTDSRIHRIYAGANELLKESIAWSL